MANLVKQLLPRRQEMDLAPMLQQAYRNVTHDAELGEHGELAKKYRKGVVVKVGGAALSEQCGDKIFEEIKILGTLGVPLVLVHGGGKEITEEMEKQGIPVRKINGQRVTSGQTIILMEQILSGIGKDIANSLNSAGIPAEHLFGNKDMLKVQQLSEELQLVGSVKYVQTAQILELMRKGVVPVITPLGSNGKQVFNVNADHASAAIAIELGVDKIVFITNVKGIHDGNEFLHEATVRQVRQLMDEGVIRDGMIQKSQSIIATAQSGIRTSVISGSVEGSLISHLFGSNGAGTEILRI